MSVCEHCTARNSWDCEDYHPQKWCDSFKLDFDSLTKKQQKAIKRILIWQEIDDNEED